jgi:hypothetical protein
MTIDFKLLADALTIFLAPALPYLVKAGTSAVEKVGEGLGEGVWEKAKALWARLGPKVEEKEAAREAVADVVQDPKDEGARATLQHQLKKILASDEALAAEVQKLLEEAGTGPRYNAQVSGSGAAAQGPGAVAAGERGIAVGGNIHGGTFNTGDRRGEDR